MFKKHRLFIFTLFALMLALTACEAEKTYVIPGQIYYEKNLEYVPGDSPIEDQYIIWATVGDEIPKHMQGEYKSLSDPNKRLYDFTIDGTHAVVGRNESGQEMVGIYGNRYLELGDYYDIPDVAVELVVAVVVPEGYFGVYVNRLGEHNIFDVLPPGTHAVPANIVVLFKSTVMRYRTLGGDAWDTYKAGSNEPCLSETCEYIIKNVPFSDTDLLSSVDVDISFKLCREPRCAARLQEMGKIEDIVQNWIATPARSYIRTSAPNFDPAYILTEEGKLEFEQMIFEYLESENAGEPLIIEDVDIRSIKIGSDEYRKAQEELAERLAILEDENQQATEEAALIAIQQEAEALVNKFLREQAQLNSIADADRIQTILEAFQGYDWRTVYAILDLLDINTGLDLDGTPTDVVAP